MAHLDLEECEDDVRKAITGLLESKDFAGVFCVVWTTGKDPTVLIGPPPKSFKAMAGFLRGVADDYENVEQ